MATLKLKDLIDATVHIGHVKSRWVPAMAPYIWGAKNNIHLIDVSKTARQLEKAAQFLESLAAENKPILWLGTKKAAQNIIQSHAIALKSPYVTHRWIGGTLTNFPQVKKSVTKLLHYEDIATKADEYLYTKKEINKFQKLADRLRKNVGGIRKLVWPIGAIVIVDVKKEQAAVREAMKAGIPIVAMVDTNSDPSGITYVIPANDDAPRSIALVIDYLAQATARGLEKAAQKASDKVKEREEESREEISPIPVTAALELEEEETPELKKDTKQIAPARKRPIKKTKTDAEELDDKEDSRKNSKKPSKGPKKE